MRLLFAALVFSACSSSSNPTFGSNVDAHVSNVDAHIFNDAHMFNDAHEPVDAPAGAGGSDGLTCSSMPPIPSGSADSEMCTETLTVGSCVAGTEVAGPCQITFGSGASAFTQSETSIVCGNTFVPVACSAPLATKVTCVDTTILCGSAD
ncbi:MAG TPA: hypothetical protein VGG74_18965 [Kofleriaceae bacterium]